jgi:hypothetical protein
MNVVSATETALFDLLNAFRNPSTIRDSNNSPISGSFVLTTAMSAA